VFGRKREQQTVNLCCSFCGKSQRDVRKLIAGPTVYICDECIGLCNDIIAEEDGSPAPEARIPTEALRTVGDQLERIAKLVRMTLRTVGEATAARSAMESSSPALSSCAFCGTSEDSAQVLISGPRVSICEACIVGSAEDLAEALKRIRATRPSDAKVKRLATLAQELAAQSAKLTGSASDGETVEQIRKVTADLSELLHSLEDGASPRR